MNEVLNINNVRGYLDKETGTAYLNAEDVARRGTRIWFYPATK